ncbi:MAG: DUF2505 domain-containing protein [Propionibacteriaceae bacterium]
MNFTSRNDFAATPDAVITMLTDRAFIEEVCRAGGVATPDIATDNYHTSYTFAFPAPALVKKFTDATVRLTADTNWSDAASDGSRDGILTISASGLPMKAGGTATLRPDGRGTVIDYRGDFSVTVPIIGKKIEKQATLFIPEAFQLLQEVGDKWICKY